MCACECTCGKQNVTIITHSTHKMPIVPNIILAHELILTSNTSANISVTYADCVDDTSDFMVEVKYWSDGSDVVSLPLEPLSTSVFVLSDLMPGSVYWWYEIRVTENSSGAQIGDTVTGLLTTFPQPTSTSFATPTAVPTNTPTVFTPTASTSPGIHTYLCKFPSLMYQHLYTL